MKLTSQEEYGLRCLLRIAREEKGLTLPEISEAEGISLSYAGKLMRVLRRGGFVSSVRGQAGGYTLARPVDEVLIGEVLALLGGRLFDPAFCDSHSGVARVCTHSVDCSIRSLWHAVQVVVDRVLDHTTLKELLAGEQEMASWVAPLIKLADAEARAFKPPEPAAPLT
jgi:Rrf2 family protein